MSNTRPMPYNVLLIAKISRFSLGVFMAWAGFFILFCIYELIAIAGYQNDTPTALQMWVLDWIDIVEGFGGVIGYGYAALFFGSAILSSIWIYRSSANAASVAPNVERIGPGWAVGWFAVPIANFWMPFRAMKQCWNSFKSDDQDLNGPVPGWMGLWWGSWLFANIAGRLESRLPTDTLAELNFLFTVSLLTTPFAILSAFLFSRLIRELTETQLRPASQYTEVFE